MGQPPPLSHTTVEQRGGTRSAFVNQREGIGSIAKDNRALVEQQGTNSAAIRQGKVGEATDNQATIRQEGENGATINQGAGLNGIARNNRAYATQSGFENDLTIDQGTLGGIALNNIATAEQDGTDNRGLIQQAGTFGLNARDNEALLKQTGEENEAFLFQAGVNDYIDIVQQGKGNTAIVAQGTGVPCLINTTDFRKVNPSGSFSHTTMKYTCLLFILGLALFSRALAQEH